MRTIACLARTHVVIAFAAALLSCSGTTNVLQSTPDSSGSDGGGTADGPAGSDGASRDSTVQDSGRGPDGTTTDGSPMQDSSSVQDSSPLEDSPIVEDGSCPAPVAFPGDGSLPPWGMGYCPDAGCPSGSECVFEQIAAGGQFIGCAPIPAACAGTVNCGCMGCVCGWQCSDQFVQTQGYLECETPTASRRAAKTDIVYVEDAEREELARQALETRLARYRYKNEPPEARRRLGFLIDDQPDPSPAVDSDRAHVDQYGYTSMLLATVQQQAKEIEEMRHRLDALDRTPERSEGTGCHGVERRPTKH